MGRIVAVLLLALTALTLSQFQASGQEFRSAFGKRTIEGGQTYKSPNHVFSVVLPQPTAFERMPYSVHEEVKKGDHEIVTFIIWDFGEMYSAGVLLNSGQENLGAIADLATISAKHQLANPPQSIEETKIGTQFGEGLLKVYFAKDGSLLQSGPDSKHMKTNDSYIAVIVARQGTRTFYAVAQDDNIGFIEKHPVEKWKGQLKDIVQKFFATIVSQ